MPLFIKYGTQAVGDPASRAVERRPPNLFYSANGVPYSEHGEDSVGQQSAFTQFAASNSVFLQRVFLSNHCDQETVR